MNESLGFIIGEDGGGNPQVSKTINGGGSWTTTNLPISGLGFNGANKMFFFDSNIGYIVCRSGHIYKTTNQGTDWDSLTSGTTEDLTSVHFPTSTVGYVSLMSSPAILKTTNGGTNWTSKPLPLFGVQDLFFTDANTGYLPCGNSTILKTTDGGDSWNVFSFGTTDAFYAIEFTSSNIG